MTTAQLTLSRTLTAVDGNQVTWETVVKNDNEQTVTGQLDANALVPQDVDRTTVTAVEGPSVGTFDPLSHIWSFNLPAGGSDTLTLSATKVGTD